MALGLKRIDLQAIARSKLVDAELLLSNGRYSNAYYLGGYAVEVGLKACIARQFTSETIPDRNFVNAVFSHNFKSLVGLAGLNKDLKDHETNNSTFSSNWALVTEWTPDSRYDTVDRYSAQIFLQAVSEPNAGVFPWIQIFW